MEVNISDTLRSGDHLILYCNDDKLLLEFLLEYIQIKSPKTKVLHCIENIAERGCAQYLNRNMMQDILSLYRLYEFSDKAVTVFDTDQYGSLFNFVKTGILTKQEMVDALLYKIS